MRLIDSFLLKKIDLKFVSSKTSLSHRKKYVCDCLRTVNYFRKDMSMTDFDINLDSPGWFKFSPTTVETIF